MTLLNHSESLFLDRDQVHKIVKLFLHILERHHRVLLGCLVALISLVLLVRLLLHVPLRLSQHLLVVKVHSMLLPHHVFSSYHVGGWRVIIVRGVR